MKKILLASQYKTLLQRYSSLLLNWGFTIFTTTSGEEALRLHQEHHFDLIVSDLELAGMSMGTFCSLVRQGEDDRNLPIIITCHDIPSRVARARQLGASAILLKPVEPIKLLAAIGNEVGLNLLRGKRVELKVVVTIVKDKQEVICFSRDISNSGMLVKSGYGLKIADRVNCRFTLPTFGPVETDGEVVRYMTDLDCDNLYGIKFIATAPPCRQAINEFVNSPPALPADAGRHNAGSNAHRKDKGRLNELRVHLPDSE